jgi:UDP-glucuronate 4-epimerase
MRAFVTGAAGFVGSHLVERLVADGHEVVAVDALTPYYDLRQKRDNVEMLANHAGCRVSELDLRTIGPTALDGVDVIFHQAGQPGVRASWREGFAGYLEHNVLATQRLLEAAVAAGVPRFVFASSSSVYGEAPIFPTSEEMLPAPRSPYGVTKLAAEHLCGAYERASSMTTVSLRYFTVYGPRQRPDMAMFRLIRAALEARSFVLYGDGEQVRDFTYVADVVEANVLAAVCGAPAGAVINIAGGSATTLSEVISTVEDLTGSPILRDPQPAPPGDVRRTGGSIERARDLLGWEPRVNLQEGLARQVAWYRGRIEREASVGLSEGRVG